jgi:hypothetical protein
MICIRRRWCPTDNDPAGWLAGVPGTRPGQWLRRDGRRLACIHIKDSVLPRPRGADIPPLLRVVAALRGSFLLAALSSSQRVLLQASQGRDM